MKKRFFRNLDGTFNISRIELAVSIVIMFIALLIFFTDGLNTINYYLPEYDDAYNATVSANFARYGQYRVSYPKDIVFYNLITTGVPVLLPTAIIYKIFGISEVTTGIVPLVYATLSLILIFILLCNCWGNVKGRYIVSALLTLIFFFSGTWLDYMSTRLLGEGASAFFLLLALLFFQFFYTKKKRLFLFLAGFFVAPAFLTKSAMIFFVVVFSGLIFIDGVFLKQIKKRNVVDYHLGFISGFFIFDLFKLITLGGLKNYCQWWICELFNMFNQSSGVDLAYSVKTKFDFLHEILFYNNYLCLFFMLVPVAIYLVYFVKTFFGKRELAEKFAVMRFAGLGGASLLWYFLFFGGAGLIAARRQSVNALFIKLSFTWLLGYIFFTILKLKREKALSLKKKLISALLIACLLYAFVPYGRCKVMIRDYIKKENSESESSKITKEFLKKIELLPADASLYSYGWWDEPLITLFLDRRINDISGLYARKQLLEMGKLDDIRKMLKKIRQNVYLDLIDNAQPIEKDSYFIVGRSIRDIMKKDLEDNLGLKLIKVDGVSFNDYADDESKKSGFDLCSIYKIEDREIPQEKSVPLEDNFDDIFN